MAAKKKPEVYVIHSAVRTQATRVQRALSPTRHRFNQILGGGLVSVRRKRPANVTRKLLDQLLPELKEKEKLGMLYVTTPAGDLVDLSTMKAAPAKQVESPKPHPPQDSIANDKNVGTGQPMPPFEGGHPATSTPKPPAVTQPEPIPEGWEEGDDEPELVKRGKRSGRKKRGG